MFLTEQDLRDTFWANYNYNNRAIKYQFECPLRQGNIDLVTVTLLRFENDEEATS